LPAKRLRELMESLHLTITYDHKDHTAQIGIALAHCGEGDLQVVPLVCSGGTRQTSGTTARLVRLAAKVALPAKNSRGRRS
jgi:hypothetical protein